MQTFIWGSTVVEFADFSGLMLRQEQGTTPAGVRQNRYWVQTAEGEQALDLFDRTLQVSHGDKISVLFGRVRGADLRCAVCVFNHSASRLIVLSDGKALHREILQRRSSILPFLVCVVTSAVAGGFFGLWGAPAGWVVYYLLKAEETKHKMLLINGLDLFIEKLSKRFVREDTRRNVSRLLARHS